jgi:hypothetical protein
MVGISTMETKDKLAIVAAGLALCAILLTAGLWRHRNDPPLSPAPLSTEETEQANQRAIAERARQDAWRIRSIAGLKRGHETKLHNLLQAEGMTGANTCDRTWRGHLRAGIYEYALARRSSYRSAQNAELVKETAETWETELDRQAIDKAVTLMQSGYVVASDFKYWEPEYSDIIPVPKDIAPVCVEPIDD